VTQHRNLNQPKRKVRFVQSALAAIAEARKKEEAIREARTHPPPVAVQTCTKKRVFLNQAVAEQAADKAKGRGFYIVPYKCKFCLFWHMTRDEP
jgi:hypothetical protein